jgi:hypothetical protein
MIEQFGNANVITVTNEDGQALAGAKILIGQKLGNPFQGNFLTTNAQGKVAAPEAWTDTQPVTVHAPGYVRLTHFGRRSAMLGFQLRKATKEPSLELNGVTNGHEVKNSDGQADFGLVISALTRNDVLAFDLNKVISNKMDIIKVMGQELPVPSNVTLPKQRENYILPITIDKPGYRLYFGEKGTQRVFAAKARFPFKKVVNELRANKKFYELINEFDLLGGIVRDVSISATKTRLDLDVAELSFTETRSIKAPDVSNNEVLISLATADMNGWLVPTDVKRLTSNETRKMSVLTGQTPYSVSVLKRADEFEGSEGTDRLSAVILPFKNGVNPQFLDLIRNPRVASNGEVQIQKPKPVLNVNELATYAIYSDVREIPAGGDVKIPFLVRLWEVYAPEWVDTLSMPVWPEGTPEPAKKRWEVTYIGSQTRNSAELGQPTIDAATHVTHSSVDF